MLFTSANKSFMANIHNTNTKLKLEIYPQIYTYTYISPGGNTSQSSSYTATHHTSRKLSKLDEPDIQDTATEVGTSS